MINSVHCLEKAPILLMGTPTALAQPLFSALSRQQQFHIKNYLRQSCLFASSNCTAIGAVSPLFS